MSVFKLYALFGEGIADAIELIFEINIRIYVHAYFRLGLLACFTLFSAVGTAQSALTKAGKSGSQQGLHS